MSEEGGVAAVDRALSILEALTEDRVSLADLAKRPGLYKSTVLRLLKSLEKAGYTLRLDDGNYRLGSKVLALGAIYQRHFRTSDIVPPVLERLAAEVHEGASYYVQEGGCRVCLHRVDSSRAIRDSVHAGDRLPLTIGAAGHVLRAFSGARGAQFEQIRRRMYSASYGERDAETAAVAAPVFGPGNDLMGALSVSGPCYRLQAAGESTIASAIFRCARELTRTFGGNPDDAAFVGWSVAREAAPAGMVALPDRAARASPPARRAKARAAG